MDNQAVWETERGILVRVTVKPQSKERRFVSKVSEEGITLNLKSPAREGKANTELLKKLAKVLGLSTGQMSIVAGHKGREKTILLVGVSREEVLVKLQRSANT